VARYENHAAVAEIGQADGVPRGLLPCWLAAQQSADIVRRCGHHGFDHRAGFWHPHRHRCRFYWRNGDADPNGKDVGKSGIALVLIHQNETPRIGQLLDAA